MRHRTTIVTIGALATAIFSASCGAKTHATDPVATTSPAALSRSSGAGEANRPTVTYPGQPTTTTMAARLTTTAPPPTTMAATTTTTRVETIPGVLFATDSTELSSDARTAVEAAITRLSPGPGDALLIVGYADDRGTPEHNHALAQGRADAVATLISEITPALKGRIRAVADDTLRDATCRGDCPQNRAVVITVHTTPGA